MVDDTARFQDDDATSYEREGYDICGCGCTRAEHGTQGDCLYCGDCDGFTLDEESTILSCIERPDVP